MLVFMDEFDFGFLWEKNSRGGLVNIFGIRPIADNGLG